MGAIDFKSKTFWAGLGLIIYGLVNSVATGFSDGDALQAMVEGFGLIGVRHAIAKAK